jgi:Tfp pilus assembly protein PilN
MDREELLELKEKIDQAKAKVSELTGRRDYLLQQLKDRWDCKDIKAGEKLLKQKAEEIQKLEEDIQTRVQELKEKYDV